MIYFRVWFHFPGSPEIVHWPGTSVKDSDPKAKTANPKLRAETWKALEEIYASGKAKVRSQHLTTTRHLLGSFLLC